MEKTVPALESDGAAQNSRIGYKKEGADFISNSVFIQKMLILNKY